MPTTQETFDQANKVLQQYGMTPVSPTGTLRSEDIIPTPEINYATQQDPSLPSIESLNAKLDSTNTPTSQETKQSDIINRLTSELNPQLAGESAYRFQQEESQGLPGMLKTQQDLSGQLTQLQAEAKAIPIQIQQESTGRGITAGGAAPLERGRLRDNAIKALTVSSTLEATRGNISLALSLVDRAVSAKYDPIREQIKIARDNLDLIIRDPNTSLQDKKRAEAQQRIQDQKKAILKEDESNQKAIWNLATTAAQNGADALTIRNIQNATTKEEAIKIAAEAGVYKKEDITASAGSVEEFKLIYGRMPDSIEELNRFTASRSASGRAPTDTSGASEATIQFYANEVLSGNIELSNVPADTRNAVALKLSVAGDPFHATIADEIQREKSTGTTLDKVLKDIESNANFTEEDKIFARAKVAEVYGTDTGAVGEELVSGFGKEGFSNVDVQERAKQLSTLGLNSVEIRNQLIKNGYDKNAATAAANQYGGVVENVVNSITNYLFGE